MYHQRRQEGSRGKEVDQNPINAHGKGHQSILVDEPSLMWSAKQNFLVNDLCISKLETNTQAIRGGGIEIPLWECIRLPQTYMLVVLRWPCISVVFKLFNQIPVLGPTVTEGQGQMNTNPFQRRPSTAYNFGQLALIQRGRYSI